MFPDKSQARTIQVLFVVAFPLLMLTSRTTVEAFDFTGPVVSVLDSDTIKVLHNNYAERIRLNAIDCPEKGQAYGQKAKHAASGLAFGKEVTLQTHGLDKYGRTIADVLLLDGTNVNRELVKQGWCWWYRKYAPADRVVEGLETEAREWRGTMGTALFHTRSVPHASMGSRHDVHTKDDRRTTLEWRVQTYGPASCSGD